MVFFHPVTGSLRRRCVRRQRSDLCRRTCPRASPRTGPSLAAHGARVLEGAVEGECAEGRALVVCPSSRAIDRRDRQPGACARLSTFAATSRRHRASAGRPVDATGAASSSTIQPSRWSRRRSTAKPAASSSADRVLVEPAALATRRQAGASRLCRPRAGCQALCTCSRSSRRARGAARGAARQGPHAVGDAAQGEGRQGGVERGVGERQRLGTGLDDDRPARRRRRGPWRPGHEPGPPGSATARRPPGRCRVARKASRRRCRRRSRARRTPGAAGGGAVQAPPPAPHEQLFGGPHDGVVEPGLEARLWLTAGSAAAAVAGARACLVRCGSHVSPYGTRRVTRGAS